MCSTTMQFNQHDEKEAIFNKALEYLESESEADLKELGIIVKRLRENASNILGLDLTEDMEDMINDII